MKEHGQENDIPISAVATVRFPPPGTPDELDEYIHAGAQDVDGIHSLASALVSAVMTGR